MVNLLMTNNWKVMIHTPSTMKHSNIGMSQHDHVEVGDEHEHRLLHVDLEENEKFHTKVVEDVDDEDTGQLNSTC